MEERKFKIDKLPLKETGCVEYIDDFFTKEESDEFLVKLLDELKLEKNKYEGRKTALYGTAKYSYAKNVNVEPFPYTKELLFIKKRVEDYYKSLDKDYTFNVCLINYYDNGKEKFNFHSDQEEIGNSHPIASISLGAKRKFYFLSKDQDKPKEEHQLYLSHGSLLTMDSKTHENYRHALPADNKVKECRLNLTFRHTFNQEILK